MGVEQQDAEHYMISRTPLLIDLIESQPVPVDWPTKIGLPAPGMQRKEAYPAGKKKGKGKGPGVPDHEIEYSCDKEGKKLAAAHRSMFPGRRVKVCGKTKSI